MPRLYLVTLLLPLSVVLGCGPGPVGGDSTVTSSDSEGGGADGSGSGDESFPHIFDENGTWTLQEYSEDGDGFTNLSGSADRKDAFILRFSSEHGVVAAAACSSWVGEEDFSPASSSCRLADADRKWRCSCYAYEWREPTVLAWLRYEPGPGEIPPDPGTADPDSTTAVPVAESGPNRYSLSPLPAPLFDSDGVNSIYVFQSKSNSLFDESECLPNCLQ